MFLLRSYYGSLTRIKKSAPRPHDEEKAIHSKPLVEDSLPSQSSEWPFPLLPLLVVVAPAPLIHERNNAVSSRLDPRPQSLTSAAPPEESRSSVLRPKPPMFMWRCKGRRASMPPSRSRKRRSISAKGLFREARAVSELLVFCLVRVSPPPLCLSPCTGAGVGARPRHQAVPERYHHEHRIQLA